MMSKLNSLLIRTSRSPWRFALLAVLNASSFAILFALEDRFEAITGLPVFDTQNGLTPEALLWQLPLYQGEALEAYLTFAAFDFVFPFVAALFLAVTWELLLRVTPWRLTRRLLARGMPLYAFLGTGFDYLENLSLLSVLAMDTPSGFIVDAAILCKRLKLAALGLSSALTMVLGVFALIALLQRLRRSRGVTPEQGIQEGLK